MHIFPLMLQIATAQLVVSLAAMRRFYFHVECDGKRTLDQEGSEHSDLESVQTLAIRAATDLAADDLKHGTSRVEHSIVVENESGQGVVRVRVFALVEVQAAH